MLPSSSPAVNLIMNLSCNLIKYTVYIKMRVCSVLTLLVPWNWLVLFVSSENVSLPPSSCPQRLPGDLYENYTKVCVCVGGWEEENSNVHCTYTHLQEAVTDSDTSCIPPHFLILLLSKTGLHEAIIVIFIPEPAYIREKQ